MTENELKLFCQNCCARYGYCIDKNTLHPYDRAAETCPDFLPKDIYKAVERGLSTNRNIDKYVTKSNTPCYYRRKLIDPDFRPLPDNLPLAYWTKEQLEEAKKYALKMIEKEGKP